MAWLRLPSITATQGSITVTVNNDFETEHIQVGDGLLVGQFALVEIVGIHSQQLTLKDAWPNATQTNVAGAIVPTASDFQLAANLLREATTITHGNFAAMEQWWTENTDVTFTAYDGSKHSVPSAQKMQDALSAKGTNPYEHQYNKIRNALRNLYDASGIVHWGKHGSDPINQGMYTDLTTPNSLMWGGGSNGDSETAYPVINVAGHEIHVRGINHSDPNTNRLVFQDAENGTRTVNTSTGVVTQHADATTAFAAAAATNVEVIVRRVDLKYGEAFLEVDPVEMFPYGMCKSGLASIDGIATEPSSRPDSYHAAFVGEVVTNKQCVKVAKLTFVQLAKLMSNPKNNWFYNDDGALTQLRYRDKVVGGTGNGDWLNIDHASTSSLAFSANGIVRPQGGKDTPDDSAWFSGSLNASNPNPEKGVFSANGGGAIAYKGECYALVLCTVPRLNMGAYSHANSFGSRSWHAYGVATNLKWTDSRLGSAVSIQSASFIASSATDSIGYKGDSGSISYGNSGHPDGLLHDAIYASGFNGVIDHRQPAKSPQDNWKESLQGYYAAKIRGVQKLPFSFSNQGVSGGNGVNSGFGVNISLGASVGYFAVNAVNPLFWDSISKVGTTMSLVEVSTGHVLSVRFTSRRNANVFDFSVVSDDVNKAFRESDDFSSYYFVITHELDTSVSGAFSCNTVIADPANWVQTPQIAQGVIGVWSPVTPDGSTKQFAIVRKLLLANSRVWTRDDGGSWSTGALSVNKATNEHTTSLDSTGVMICNYKAYAYQVEDGENLKPVTGQTGKVSCSAWYNPNGNGFPLFAEAAIHKVLKSGAGFPDIDMNLTCSRFNLDATGSIVGDVNGLPEHVPLSLGAPQNNSPAIKALPFLVEKNGYLYIAWHVNELGWDSTTPTDIDGKLGSTLVANKKYRVNTGASYLWVTAVKSGSNVTFNNFAFLPNGEYRNAGNELWAVSSAYTGDWGDDSKIKVTSKGWDTFVDLNGNKMTRRVVISAFPIGPAKKKTLVGGLSSPA